MKVGVFGLWHLGMVTAACLAKGGHEVIACDTNQSTIDLFKNGELPVAEPGIKEIIAKNTKSDNLTFTSNPEKFKNCEIVWITFDTPVDDNDIADVNFVEEQIKSIFTYLSENTLVIISSQLPIGTTRKLINVYNDLFPDKKVTFAYSPENLRLGSAIEVFTNPDRIIMGLDSYDDRDQITKLLNCFTDNYVWMSVESAEMTKHAINAFLATSVVFANTLATICEKVGADAREVEEGLKSEKRIGRKAYLRPGNAFAGGTLARDIAFIKQVGSKTNTATTLFDAVLEGNIEHKKWSLNRLTDVLGDLQGKTISILGLTYKTGTDTLRRSSAIELCNWLHEEGVKIQAYDPAVKSLPDKLKFIHLKKSCVEALNKADAMVISTEWPEFENLTVDQVFNNLNTPNVFDANGFFEKTLGRDSRINYFSVGRVL